MGHDRRRVLALVGALGLAATSLAGCQLFPGSPDFVVTTTLDGADADPGDGICEVNVGADDCSLRAAITEANASAVVASVTVPAGTYPLTLAGVDDTNAVGDLDVAPLAGSMVITADGAAGFAIDATGADAGIDVRSGNVALFGIGVSGAAGDGLSVRSGAFGALSLTSLHGNAGAGVRVAPSGRAQLWDTTVSGNGAGGVANQGLTSTKFATITDNTGGGFTGVGNDSPTAGVVIDSSIVLDQASGPACSDGSLSIVYSVVGQYSPCGYGAGTVESELALLQPLTDGLVPVHPLTNLAPDLARNRIPFGSGACVPGSSGLVDQLGAPRPVGGACDAGAFEEQAPITVVVDDAADAGDTAPGDGACQTAAGTCSLRAAIDETNARLTADTITIAPGVDPQLTIAGRDEDANATGDLDIRSPIVIEGGGATIDGNGVDRIFDSRAIDDLVRFEDMTVVGGDVGVAPGGGAGAIASGGGLRLERVVLSGNRGADAGALGADVAPFPVGAVPLTSTVELTDVRAEANTGGPAVRVAGGNTDATGIRIVDNDGGGMAFDGDSLLIGGSTFSGNHGGDGAGLHSRSRVTSIDETWFDANVSTGDGGGALVETNFLHVWRSTFSANIAAGDGGGLHHAGTGPNPSHKVETSTFTDNQAVTGSALWSTSTATFGIDIEATTVVDNSGGASLHADALRLRLSIVSAGSGTACSVTPGFSYTNLFGDTTCGAGATNVVGSPGPLGPLQDNGGSTPTRAPGAGSPAIDAIAPTTVIPGPFPKSLCPFWSAEKDQRGVLRPQGPACDIGSVEQ